MAPVVFAREWRAGVDRMIATEPGFAADIHPMLKRLNDPSEARPTLYDVVSQRWRQVRCDWYDAAALIDVGLHLQAGWSVLATVHLGATAGRDKDLEGNNRKLRAPNAV